MDLGLDLQSSIGRKSRPVQAEVVRDLRPEDLALLSLERGIKPKLVKKLRDSHHALARCLATALSDTEASIITGYTPSRISVLRGDPAFQELVEHYRSMSDAPVADFQNRLVAIKHAAAERMLEKLEDDEVPPSEDFILDAAKFAADRSGHGPQSKSTNLNVHVNLADRLAAGRQRAAQVLDSNPPRTIEHRANEAGTVLRASLPPEGEARRGEDK